MNQLSIQGFQISSVTLFTLPSIGTTKIPVKFFSRNCKSTNLSQRNRSEISEKPKGHSQFPGNLLLHIYCPATRTGSLGRKLTNSNTNWEYFFINWPITLKDIDKYISKKSLKLSNSADLSGSSRIFLLFSFSDDFWTFSNSAVLARCDWNLSDCCYLLHKL